MGIRRVSCGILRGRNFAQFDGRDEELHQALPICEQLFGSEGVFPQKRQPRHEPDITALVSSAIRV